MSLSDYIPEKFLKLFSDPDFSQAIKGYSLYLIREDPEYRAEIKKVVNEELDNSFDTHLATSELKPIKRIAELETVTGLNDFSDFEEEHEPTIPERITSIEERISAYQLRPTVSLTENKTPKTKTEIRASLLVEALTGSGKPYLSTPEIMNFLKCKLPENCKIDENVQNIRKVKQDVVKKAAEMFSHVKMNKKTTGHKDVRLILVS